MRKPGAGFPLSLYQPWEAILRTAISAVVREVYGNRSGREKRKDFNTEVTESTEKTLEELGVDYL